MTSDELRFVMEKIVRLELSKRTFLFNDAVVKTYFNFWILNFQSVVKCCSCWRKDIQGFFKSQSLCKFTDCKDNFVCLVWPTRGKLFLQQSSIQKVLPACED